MERDKKIANAIYVGVAVLFTTIMLAGASLPGYWA